MPGLDALHRHHFWDGMLAAMTLVLAGAAAQVGFSAAAGQANIWQIAAGIACAAAAGCIAYGSLIAPRRIVTRTQRVVRSGLPPMRVAVFSDTHVGPLKGEAFLRRLVRRCNVLQPDLVLLPGDFLYDANSSLAPLAELGGLRAPLGIFAVIGNHDSGSYIDLRHRAFRTDDRSDDVAQTLEELGIRVLRNDVARVATPHGPCAIAGIEDLWSPRYADVPGFLRGLDRSVPTILLSHHPDAALDPGAQGIPLVVSGHTHGGQIRLPLLGPLLPIPCALGRKYDRGLFRLASGTALFITHGTGETMIRARFFAPPEVVLLEIE